MQNIYDSVKNQKVMVNEQIVGGAAYGDTKICFQMEYDSSIYTGRVTSKGESTPNNKRYRLAMTLYKFKDLLYDPKYPFGIYAGGPNEQGYNMEQANNNTNKHSDRNHLTLVDRFNYLGHQQKYIDLANLMSPQYNENGELELNSFDNTYNTRIIYDVTNGLMNNNWSNQAINGFNSVCNELKFNNSMLIY